MKQLVAIFSFVFIFFSCDHNWQYAIISNEASYPVTFKFKNVEEEHHLPAGQSQRFDSYWTTKLELYTPEKRVQYSYTSSPIILNDRI
jgi:hypothetical protein